MSYYQSKMCSSDGPSLNQSLENYEHFKNKVKGEMLNENIFKNIFKVTHVNILDELLKKELINSQFHKSKLRECILEDKIEETRDLFYSMLVSGIIIATFFIFIIPHDKYVVFKFLYLSYISIVYLLAYLFWRKLV